MKSRYVFLLGVLLFFGFSRLEEVSSQLRNQAIELFRQGQYERFVRFTEWSLSFPDEEILSLRAIALLKLGKEAQREITHLFQSSSSLILDYVSYYYLDYLIKQDDAHKVLSWLALMEERFPNSPLLTRAYLLTSKSFLKKGLTQHAISMGIKLLTLAPFPEEKQEIFWVLSQSLIESQHFSEAFWILQKVHRDAPQQSSEIRFLVQSIISQMDFQRWSPPAKITGLEFLLALGLYEEIEPLIIQTEEEMLTSPLEKRFFVLQARVALHSNNLAQLENAIQKVTQKNEEEVLYYQGILEQRKERYAQAIQKYEKVVTNFPRGEYVLQAYRNMALCYRNLGKEKEYADTLQRVIALFPQETISFWELFRFFYLRNQTKEMKTILKQLAKTNHEERNRALFWLYKL
ncbi:MAG: tetratricopeptide repeat protein, partial [Candidatus Caldatribacteriaceae bacterium]